MPLCDTMYLSEPLGEVRQPDLHPVKMRLAGIKTVLVSLSFSILSVYGTECLASMQPSDYRTVFGDGWVRAEEIIKENSDWMQKLSKQMGVSYSEAIAVVFPELIRYSALRDKMEITLLKTLYINLGDEYADFSIGPFQMKPSFAEQIHKELTDKSVGKSDSLSGETKEYRARVIDDLEDIKSQFVYLLAFMKYCQLHYKADMKEENHRVRFLASAYNCGFMSGAERIRAMMGKKYFSTGLIARDYYSYSDISMAWYVDHLERRK